jgi:hypothetical protein
MFNLRYQLVEILVLCCIFLLSYCVVRSVIILLCGSVCQLTSRAASWSLAGISPMNRPLISTRWFYTHSLISLTKPEYLDVRC